MWSRSMCGESGCGGVRMWGRSDCGVGQNVG